MIREKSCLSFLHGVFPASLFIKLIFGLLMIRQLLVTKKYRIGCKTEGVQTWQKKPPLSFPQGI